MDGIGLLLVDGEYRRNVKEIKCAECRRKCRKGQAVLYAKEKADRWTGLCTDCFEALAKERLAEITDLLDTSGLDPAVIKAYGDDPEFLALLARPIE